MIGALLIAQLAIVARAPTVVATCDAVEVSVAVTAPDSTVPELVAPDFAPFQVLRASGTPHIQSDPRLLGKMVAEYRYVLTTERTGAFTLPPFEVHAGGETARSRPLRVVVRAARTAPISPTVVAAARIDRGRGDGFRALALPETVFVGQQANYEVAVFLNQTVRDRLRRNPTFYPPDMPSMLAYDVPPKEAVASTRRVGARCFDALVYQRALFPLEPGRLVIPPAQLVYSLPLSASFFSREESYELQTDSTVIVAVEPPRVGRPSDFTGAVGDLSLRSWLDSGDGRVGNPLLLTVRVAGTGNVKLLPPPPLAIPWASVVAADERVQVDSTAPRIRGAKEFDWVLTPRVAGELDLPPIRYSYFNPDTRRYETATSESTRVRIAPGALAAADTVRSDALLALRPAYRGPVAPPPHQRPGYWLLLAVAPLPAFGLRVRRRTARQRVAPTAAMALRALSRAPAAARDSCDLRRAYVAAFAERLGLPPATFTRTGALSRALRRSGVSVEAANAAERFLRTLDEAAYSPRGSLPADAATRAWTLYRGADAEALPRAQLRLPPTLGVLLLCATLAGAATLGAASANEARREFDRGVAAYHAHAFGVARAEFLAAANDEPWAPDAWANLGTAAWAASDTGTAVTGWQRALRLEPTASDARERLDLVHAPATGALAYVPALPASLLAWSAAALWLAGWLLAAVYLIEGSRTRASAARRWAYALGALGVMLLFAALEVDQRLAARDLAVIRTSSRITREAALVGEQVGTAYAGEVVRAGMRNGVWTHVALDGGRDGWIASSALSGLERGTPIAEE